MTSARVLSLADIAELAQVQRPVVSMWRRRPRVRGAEFPFPVPVATEGRIEWFDRDDVVAWLESTGRGNNDQARLDAPALTTPDDADVEDVAALICLAALTGDELVGVEADQLIAIAERVDPADQLLLREVRALANRLDLRIYVDDLLEASYGPADALERVESGRLGRGRGEPGVAPELVALVQSAVTASRLQLPGDQIVLVPPRDHHLLLPLVEGFIGVRLEGDDPYVRTMRRRATIGEVGLVAGGEGAVHVISVIGMPDDKAIDAVDDVALDLKANEVAIAVGPASALCDSLAGKANQRRAETLREGKLVLALRLPRGLWLEAPRHHLAIWVLRGGKGAQWFRVADLDGEVLALGDLASDVAGALQRTEVRAYRYARSVELRPILASGPVVPRGARAVRFGAPEGAATLDRVQAASLTTSESIPGYDVSVAAGPGQAVLRQRSLGELGLANQLVMRRGSRVDVAAAVPGGTVRVLSADGSTEGVRLDPFDAAHRYRRATRTEPGDVVFLERPRPTAVVDMGGGALVASPSRILRLEEGAPIGPHTLAALINGVAPAGSEWSTWSVPDLAPAAARELDATLAAAADHLQTLRVHAAAMHDLIRHLIEGVAAGSVALDTINRKAG